MLLLLACTSFESYTAGTVQLEFVAQESPAIEAELELELIEAMGVDSALYAGCEPGEGTGRGWVHRKLFEQPTGDLQLDLCLPVEELGLELEVDQARLYVDAFVQLPAEENPATGGEEGRGTVTMRLMDAEAESLGGVDWDGTRDQLGEGWVSMARPDAGSLLATDLPFELGEEVGRQTLRVDWELQAE